ncbi:MAG: hypothetical protein JJ957_19160 [Pseudomonadales bacterium]|nr:hypothetical protein [Pseudomonadales bacterium]MBO6597614.1 hypothetical protein [Pseudomonadales bacterium]MBO6824336.1 hypothetical protein [Pseudomonadales bacterium]
METITTGEWLISALLFFLILTVNAAFGALVKEIDKLRGQLGYGYGGKQSFLADIQEDVAQIYQLVSAIDANVGEAGRRPQSGGAPR